MKEYEVRTLKIVVLPKGEPIFSELATEIEVMDEAAGEFVKLSQMGGRAGAESREIWLDPAEWPHVREGIERMMRECRDFEQNAQSDASR